MLHMMYRKLNLFNHLKAMKVFFMAGEADLMEAFAAQLFHANQECTLKDNSLSFINNAFEFALTTLRQPAGSNKQEQRVKENHNLLFSSTSMFAELFSFEYLEDKKKDNLLLNLHNLEGHLQLKYTRRYPLDLVITESCLSKYNRIFFSILKVKKVLQLLKLCWKQLNSIHFRRAGAQYTKTVRAIQLLRSSMHTFMTTFE